MIEVIKTDSAPSAIGPYSQAVKVDMGKIIFCSGQIALHPGSGEIVGETAAKQCEQVMKNLGAVLKAANSGFDRVVKTTIYLADMTDFSDVNEIYANFFDKKPPARATIEVSRLPKNVKIEIDAIAID